MGTPKRERQKANRQHRLQELAQEARKQKSKRIGLRVLIGVPLAVGLLWGLVWLVGGDDDAVTSTTTTPSVTTAPTETSLPGTTDPSGSTPDTAPAPTLATTTVPTTVPGETIQGPTPCPEADGSSPRTILFSQPPPPCIDKSKTYEAVVVTNKGEFTVLLDDEKAPLAVNNFVVLARYHYFDSTVCHRIIPGFVAQCGDPTGTGSGPNPGYRFADELPEEGEYEIGSLAMANSGANTNGSQFFVITGESGASLPANYSLFGKVVKGLEDTVPALDAAGNPEPASNGVPPLEQVVILSVTILER